LLKKEKKKKTKNIAISDEPEPEPEGTEQQPDQSRLGAKQSSKKKLRKHKVEGNKNTLDISEIPVDEIPTEVLEALQNTEDHYNNESDEETNSFLEKLDENGANGASGEEKVRIKRSGKKKDKIKNSN